MSYIYDNNTSLDPEKMIKKLIKLWQSCLFEHDKEVKTLDCYIIFDFQPNGIIKYIVDYKGHCLEFLSYKVAVKNLIDRLFKFVKEEIRDTLSVLRVDKGKTYNIKGKTYEESINHVASVYKRVILMERYFKEWK
jgi:hypothetical protein